MTTIIIVSYIALSHARSPCAMIITCIYAMIHKYMYYTQCRTTTAMLFTIILAPCKNKPLYKLCISVPLSINKYYVAKGSAEEELTHARFANYFMLSVHAQLNCGGFDYDVY